MTVIDASVVVAHCLREEGWEPIGELLRQEVSSVELLPVECANAILIAKRHHQIGPDRAGVAFETLSTLTRGVVDLANHGELLVPAFHIADRHGLTVYDALYLALAQRTGAPLATRDRAQIDVAHRLGMKLLEI